MGVYQRERDEHVLPMREFTCQLATMEPPPLAIMVWTARTASLEATHLIPDADVIAGAAQRRKRPSPQGRYSARA